MARLLWLECTECGETGEVLCDGEGPMHCPSCRSVDCFKGPEEEAACSST